MSKDEVQLELAYQIPPSGNGAKTEEDLLSAFPFCTLTLRAAKPPYPQGLRTIGDHIRKRRLDLELAERDVAGLVGVARQAVEGWENRGVGPSLEALSQVVQFLELRAASGRFPLRARE